MWNPFRLPKPIITIQEQYPDKDWIEANQLSGYTFDIHQLERSAFQLLFVYDQMMNGHRMHDCMLKDHSAFGGTAFTASDNWTLWKQKLGKGTFPIPLRVPHTMVNKARIKGQLFIVESSHFWELDKYKMNGVEFRRRRINLEIPYLHQHRIFNGKTYDQPIAEHKIASVTAWMYVGRYKYWQNHLDAGYNFSTVRIFEPGGLVIPGKYYSFTPLELDD